MATNVNHSTTRSQLTAELGPAQPQLVVDIVVVIIIVFVPLHIGLSYGQ